MFNVNVTNFKGCRAARFAVSPIALIVGFNSAGKSSVMYPVACAMVGQSKVFGLTKEAEKTLVPHNGAREAAVSIAGQEWGVAMSWPGGKATNKGPGLRVSPVAAGLTSLATVATKDRAAMLAGYVSADPTREEWDKACDEAGVMNKRRDRQWDEIQKAGGVWDAIFTTEKELGAQLKGQWRGITGANYGAEVAETWKGDGTPQGFPDSVTIESLELALQNAQGALETELAKGGADEAERTRLTNLLKNEPKAKQSLAAAQGDIKRWSEAQKAAEQRLQAIPVAQKKPPACPCCGKNLVITIQDGGYVVKEGGAWDENEYERLRRMEDAAQSEFESANKHLRDAQSLAEAAQRDLAAFNDHRARLEAMGDGAPGDVAGSRRKVEEAKMALRGALATSKARDIHLDILEQAKVVHLLAPGGVRATAMRRSLADLNAKLAVNCEIANWEDVAVTDDLELTYDEVPWPLLAINEQFRVMVVLQMTMAEIDKSEAILIDGAEVLDVNGRNGLFALLVNKKLPCMVAMTIPPDKAPNLAKMGIGCTIVMEDGEARVLEAA